MRILVVDEAVIYRKLVAEALRSLPDVEIAGTAVDAAGAIEKIAELGAQLVTMGVSVTSEGWDGFDRVRRAHPTVDLIGLPDFVAEKNRPDWAWKLQAVVAKPLVGSVANIRATIDQLARLIVARMAQRSETVVGALAFDQHAGAASVSAAGTHASDQRGGAPSPADGAELVCIGISTGGPEALTKMLPMLPADLAAPVLIVQHMPANFTRSLAEGLDAVCRLTVREGADGQVVRPGEIWIAPGGRQMKVERVDGELLLRITDDPPENNCRPSADYLFRSAAEACGAAVVAVIMTGMGSDGLRGLRTLRGRGARVVAQDRQSCVVYGMPMLPVEEGLADEVVPLAAIAGVVVRLTSSGVRLCR